MRLAYVTSSLPHGQGEAFILPEVLELVRQGHEVWVVPMYPRGGLVHGEALQLRDRAVVQPLVSREVALGALREFLRSPARALRALALLLTRNPRHLIKNLAVYPKGLWLGGLVSRLGVEHIHAHWAATTASMAMVASEVSGIPFSLTAHRWDVVENNLLRRKAERARFFRCISEKTLAMALERGVPREKTLVLHLGVYLPEGKPANRLEGEVFTLLCPAAFVPRKGHSYLIEAMRLLPERVHLWLAGEGELRPKLEEQVRALGLEKRVRFLGALPHERLLDLYRTGQVDAVVLASVDLGDGLNEGIPVALMEAMAFGYPVVATATGGIPELLRDGAGLLVPDKSPEALAEAILRLIQDKALREGVSRKGYLRVQQEFAVDKVVDSLLNLWLGGGCARS